MAEITVFAVFKSKPGSGEMLYEQLRAMADEARNDPGCLKFECKRSLDDDGSFLFHEEWASRADLENHQTMPYLAKYRKARAPFLDGDPMVSRWLG